MSVDIIKHTEHVSAERLRRECRTGITVVCVGEVVENAEIDGKDTNRGDRDGNCRYNPVYATPTRPAEHEHANRQACTFYTRKVEPVFGRVLELAVFASISFLIDGECAGDECAHAHRCKDSVGLL